MTPKSGSRSELRNQAMERARWSCEWPACPHPTINLEMAHLTPIGMGGGTHADTLNNVAILCHFHHMIQEGETVKGRKREVTDLLRRYLNRERQIPL